MNAYCTYRVKKIRAFCKANEMTKTPYPIPSGCSPLHGFLRSILMPCNRPSFIALAGVDPQGEIVKSQAIKLSSTYLTHTISLSELQSDSIKCCTPRRILLAKRNARRSGCLCSLRMAVELESPPEEYVMKENHKPRRIALFVEPSPFAYISGYKNRFQYFIKYLREMGDEVIVVTTHEGVPQEFYGAKVIGSWSFPCPWYSKVPLSLALSPRIIWQVAKFKPDIVHASSPGIMVFGALIIAKLLSVPLVMSYHTHVPIYIPKYTFSWLVKPMWLVIKFLHTAADLTLVTSTVVAKELKAARVAAAYKIRLWQKGVDSESFHPRYKSYEMRTRLTDGEPDKPLIVHVGRLGIEKNLGFLKMLMDRLPEARLAFIGDGPYRKNLEQMFSGMPVVFTGMLHGEELSRAYSSGDVFITPSETETLGFVVLEAMSSGVPVVAARAGGIPDIVPPEDEGKIGFLFNPGDVDDCESKVKLLLTSPELRLNVGQAGRAEAEKHDWRTATKKVRNEQYNAAIWFWRKKRFQLFRRLSWWLRYTPLKAPGVQYALR